MGHGYSGSVLEGESPIFLQAMGRRAKETRGANARRSHLGRDAGQCGDGEGVIYLNTKGTKKHKDLRANSIIQPVQTQEICLRCGSIRSSFYILEKAIFARKGWTLNL